MKSSEHPVDLSAIGDAVVRSAIVALNGRDKKRWFELFVSKPTFTDDGIQRDFVEWCEEELFGRSSAWITSVDRVEDEGLIFYARYHSGKWGDFQTFWKFVVENGRVSKLDVGATSY
jgi:hypothetical protein